METPVIASFGILTQTLALRGIVDSIKVVDLELLLTSGVLETVAARLHHWWSLRSRYGKDTIWRVCAGGLVLTFSEKEAIGACVEKLGKSEIVAV